MWSTPTATRASAPRYRVAVAASASYDRRSVIVDLPPRRRQRVPLGAELVQALPIRVAGLAVADVVVERVPGVGDLAPGAGSWDRPDLAPQRASARVRLDAGGERGPDGEARTRAVAHVRPVGFEQIERPATA